MKKFYNLRAWSCHIMEMIHMKYQALLSVFKSSKICQCQLPQTLDGVCMWELTVVFFLKSMLGYDTGITFRFCLFDLILYIDQQSFS